MKDDVLIKLRKAAVQSELIQVVSSLGRDNGKSLVLGDTPLRLLYREEIARLEGQGNSSPDWSRVQVVDGFDWRRVQHSSFHGDVLLGRCTRQVRFAENFQLPAGIYGSTLSDCVIGTDVLVRDVKLLAGYVVSDNAILMDCGAIACDGRTTFGNGVELPLGIESGGREVAIYAEIDIEIAAEVTKSRGRVAFLEFYKRAVAEYAAQVASSRGFIGQGAVVRSTPKVRNTYIGAHACIDGATLVADTTLLSNAEEPVRIESGACVSHSVVQWGSSVTSLAIVDRAVLTEHSRVQRHGKVKNSLLGPNTCVAEGEVTASLVGPFVNLQHQALLISTLWPEGRGNVSYGANVGANHTSKAPDQEFWPGEGAFLGLGVNVKFPADLSKAPYTVVASGVTLLPQKILFPFSLVNAPSASIPGVSPAFNEIIPAWLLTDNLYAIKRNESKFRARNKARRIQFDFQMFRPETIDLMRGACRRLLAVRHQRECYTDRDIEGLGKNFMLDVHRKPAAEAYRFFIRYYALMGLRDRLQAALGKLSDEAVNDVLVTPSNDHDWEHARQILNNDLGLRNPVTALRQLPGMLDKIARDMEESKAKDDERGARIIDDYTEAHVAAADDSFVRQVKDETSRMQHEIEALLDQLPAVQHSFDAAGRPPVIV